MKKLILITGILLSTSLWASPMDTVCSIYISDNMRGINTERGIEEFIKENCERNNIIRFYGRPDKNVFNVAQKQQEPYLSEIPFETFISSWCRFDRNVRDESEGVFRTITCVLYSNESRKYTQSILEQAK